MDMSVVEIEPGITAVTLDGRMDMAGAQQIDLRFSAVAGGTRVMLVDITAVPFLASIGVRTLIMGARTITRRGGRFVLLHPSPQVEEVLTVSGVLDLMPVFHDFQEALSALRSPA
jgi:anti-sigma B factor antagonist